MFSVIARHSFLFRKPGSHSEIIVPGMRQNSDDVFSIKKSPEKQQVPDWVRSTFLFKMAVKDGTILELASGQQVRSEYGDDIVVSEVLPEDEPETVEEETGEDSGLTEKTVGAVNHGAQRKRK